MASNKRSGRSNREGEVPDWSESLENVDPLAGEETWAADEAPRYIPWAQLMKKVFAIDVLECACGGRRRVIGYVTEPEKIREELGRLGLAHEVPKVSRARAPSQEEFFERDCGSDGVDPPAPDPVA